MITKLKLSNFKSHRETEMRISPLTVLTGTNSCGKTSVLQSLLLLRQSHKKNNLDKYLVLNKPLVEIGTGQDALFRYATTPNITFELTLDDRDCLRFVYDAERHLTDPYLSASGSAETYSEPYLSKIELFNEKFQYISSQRWGGKSLFPKDLEATEGKQISLELGQGELTACFLNAFGGENTYDYFKNDGSEVEMIEQTLRWEQEISAGVTMKVEPIANSANLSISFGIKGIGNNKTTTDFKAENVGYGVSYTLPVIVALISAKPGALILIENPEAHLHPDGQAAMARLMCAVANRGVQIVVETHSDHIINGILVACKQHDKGEKQCGIDKNKVTIHYLEKTDDYTSTKSTEIKISEDGGLEYQPKGFFDRAEHDREYLFFDKTW